MYSLQCMEYCGVEQFSRSKNKNENKAKTFQLIIGQRLIVDCTQGAGIYKYIQYTCL